MLSALHLAGDDEHSLKYRCPAAPYRLLWQGQAQRHQAGGWNPSQYEHILHTKLDKHRLLFVLTPPGSRSWQRGQNRRSALTTPRKIRGTRARQDAPRFRFASRKMPWKPFFEVPLKRISLSLDRHLNFKQQFIASLAKMQARLGLVWP